jgi:hypothetical protein
MQPVFREEIIHAEIGKEQITELTIRVLHYIIIQLTSPHAFQ